jgi:hypothetical protein
MAILTLVYQSETLGNEEQNKNKKNADRIQEEQMIEISRHPQVWTKLKITTHESNQIFLL